MFTGAGHNFSCYPNPVPYNCMWIHFLIFLQVNVSHYYNLLAKLTLTINFSITEDGQIEAIIGPLVRSVERRSKVSFYFHEIKMLLVTLVNVLFDVQRSYHDFFLVVGGNDDQNFIKILCFVSFNSLLRVNNFNQTCPSITNGDSELLCLWLGYLSLL